MKSIVFSFFSLIGMHVLSQQITLEWGIVHPINQTKIAAGTHGSVQEKLMAIGELPDPFYGENEKEFGWVEKHEWEFQSSFSVSKAMFTKDFIQITFPGIDTYAKVYLNDALILSAENAFRPYGMDIKPFVKFGQNELRVVFTPPVLYHKAAYLKETYHLPAPNDPDSIAISPYTRKPQYQFGWDWALRMNTIGFLKPVSLHAYSGAHIQQTNIQTVTVSDTLATLKLELVLEHPAKERLLWKSKCFGMYTILPGETRVSREVSLENPSLWWPRGQGEQSMYSDEWQLVPLVSDELIVYDQKKLDFGVRTAELVMEKDQWGTGYFIRFNGRPVFCKGADYIPQDVFPARVTDDDLRHMVSTMAESNFNMVRIWGGGYYPDEAFFDACDSLGIMVWQDFMFACAMYPGDSAFLANVSDELNYQIPRISSHPSLTLFNGNNEVDVAWKNWGFQVRYHIYGKDARYIEDSYDALFKQLIPTKIQQWSGAAYVHTSPLSNWGKDEYYNSGSQHYWGVWHGKDPMSNFATKIGRFNAEFGFQSFPEFSTLTRFAPESQWALDSAVMKHHQKSYVGNGMILKHAKLMFGQPKNFREFVYFSQLTQAAAVGMAVTGHRLDAPRCMGTLYWQLNDCWPAPTWSSIDHYWNKKALHYRIVHDYEDVAVVSAVNAEGYEAYHLINDRPEPFWCGVKMNVFDLTGKLICEKEFIQNFEGAKSVVLSTPCFKGELKNKNCVVQCTWNDAQGNQHTRTFSRLPASRNKADRKDIRIELMNVDLDNKTAMVKVLNTKFVHHFWLFSSKTNVQFSENFIDLLPGEHFIQIRFNENPALSDFDFMWL
jgi:beta-mannosidase